MVLIDFCTTNGIDRFHYNKWFCEQKTHFIRAKEMNEMRTGKLVSAQNE